MGADVVWRRWSFVLAYCHNRWQRGPCCTVRHHQYRVGVRDLLDDLCGHTRREAALAHILASLPTVFKFLVLL